MERVIAETVGRSLDLDKCTGRPNTNLGGLLMWSLDYPTKLALRPWISPTTIP